MFKPLLFLQVLALLFFVSCASQPQRVAVVEERQVVGFSFDADDNLFNLPTKIVLFHKVTGAELGVSTAKFALIRKQIGKAGTRWANYETFSSRRSGSYRYFGDEIGDGVNYFLKDLKLAMKNNPKGWKALSFDAFVDAMSTAETAKGTSIITARGHESETILEALRYLQSLGMIQHVPEADNIWAVSNPNFSQRFEKVFGKKAPDGGAAGPSARKAAIMQNILDKIDRIRVPATASKVISPNGDAVGHYQLWGFSDDDYGNFEKARIVIQKGLDEGRWKHTKVALYYTGLHDKRYKPHAVVLRPNGSPRPLRPAEEYEWKQILAAKKKRLITQPGGVSLEEVMQVAE